MSWVPNIVFGLKNVGIINSSKSGTRNRVLEPFVDWLGIDFATLHWASIAVYSAAFLMMILFMVRHGLRTVPLTGWQDGVRSVLSRSRQMIVSS